MTTTEILHYLQEEIHFVVLAAADGQGRPQTCVVDLMLADETGLYFLLARGMSICQCLKARPYVALSGLKGRDPLACVAVSLRGQVRARGRERLEEIFARNPYLEQLYPTIQSRSDLEVFRIEQGEGEYFDLLRQPPNSQHFSFGAAPDRPAGYRINPDKCIGCMGCRSVCPAGCIDNVIPRVIDESRCLRCGRCQRICPVKAVEQLA